MASISGAIALLMTIGLIIGLGVASLLTGGFYFLFGKSRLTILKSNLGETGFSFGHQWNSAREPIKFDRVRIRLFNPFGSPTQIDVTQEFAVASSDFSRDIDFGPAFKQLLQAKGLEKASVQVEISSTKEGVTHDKMYKAENFIKEMKGADTSAGSWSGENSDKKPKIYYGSSKKSFIAEPMPKSGKSLKLATNPEFAGEFASAGADDTPKENFSISKVWIAPGCIVCNACEGIFPEVFEVTEDSCLIRPDAPLNDGLRIVEAADACPVEVIKFNK